VVDSTRICPEGRDPSELLAYMEGDLPSERRKELEEHLTLCEACSGELESLRKLDNMLRASPQCFHPDEEDLYRFVSYAHDPDGRVSSHLETCERCHEAVAILRDMAAERHEISRPVQAMPPELLRRLEAHYSVRSSAEEPITRLACLLEWLRRPFGLPMLAAGTAAAVLVVVALLIPISTGLRDVPKPEGARSLQEAPISLRERDVRLESRHPSGSGDGTGLQESLGMAERPLPELKTAPSLSAIPESPTVEPSPALEKDEPLKLEKGLGQAPAASRRPEAWRAEKAVRGYVGPESGRNEGSLEQGPRKRKFAAPAAPMVKGQIDVQAKPKVLVRIIPPAGEQLQGVRFVPPEDLTSRYLFTEQMGKGKDIVETHSREPQPTAVAPAEEADYIVTIRANRRGVTYDLEGNVTERERKMAIRTLSNRNVAPDNLQAEIGGMVAALLSGN